VVDCQVRRGETAVPAVFYKQVVREKDGEDETFRVLKRFPVFNAGQVGGPKLPRRAAVDAAVQATGAATGPSTRPPATASGCRTATASS
jgi:antirestriction protein ArdC